MGVVLQASDLGQGMRQVRSGWSQFVDHFLSQVVHLLIDHLPKLPRVNQGVEDLAQQVA